MAFFGAPRYHSGGIAGLRPNEVPAILEKGERVLRRGAYGIGGGVTVNNSTQIDATGADPAQFARVTLALVQVQQQLQQQVVAIVNDAKSRRKI